MFLCHNLIMEKISFNSIKENILDRLNTYNHTPLLDAMESYKKEPMTGFHIPGHNRGCGIHPKFQQLVGLDCLNLDTTDEFDNLGTLHPATGAIKKAQELAAITYNAKRTFFVTGGSTIANLALAFALTSPFDEVLIGRNCHRSVLTGLIISGAKVNWVIPKKLDNWSIFGNIEASDIEEKLKHNINIKLVWITNPTYEGVVSDIKKIAECRISYYVFAGVSGKKKKILFNYRRRKGTDRISEQ